MSHPAMPAASGLVRVTVASGSRRIDLVLPGAVPVAELVPELARGVGLLDAATSYGGYHLLAPDGRRLSADAGLILQGIEDGAVLTVGAGVDDTPPRVYDDVVEAMADAVERELRPWSPAAGRRTALAAATGILLVGVLAVLSQRGSETGAVAAGVLAMLLAVAGVTLGRAQHERAAALCLSWLAVVHAAVAGAMAVADRALGDPVTLAAAGGAAAVAGIVGLVGLSDGRSLLIPAVVVGVIFAAVGLVLDATDSAAVAEAFTVVLVLVVIAGSLLPWVALSATRAGAPSESPAVPTPVPTTQVERDARLGHELLLGVSSTVGLLLVLVAPMAVSLGVAGALVVVAGAAVVLLRSRQYRAGSEVLAGLTSGVAALIVAALAVLVLHPDWRPALAVVLAAGSAALLAGAFLPAPSPLRRGRLGDLAESAALVALLPLLMLALGLVG